MEVERVQAIASLSAAANDIPAEFVRPEHEQPGFTTYRGPAPEIPVVDLAGEADRGALATRVAAAAREWGIFQVVNHGIPAEVVRELQRVGKAFFELPPEEKEKYASKPGSTEGYGTKLQKDLEGKKAWVDFLFHNIWPPATINYAFWPKIPPEYRKANEEYRKYLGILVKKILIMLSKGLGLEDHVLMQSVGGQNLEYLLKINYYPPCPRPDLALGVVSHTDMSAITILVPNDVPGLQVFKDDQWFDVKHIPNAIIVHIGDQIEILSNGFYKSVLHRTTVNKEKARMSWPVFCSPPPEMEIGPLPQLVSDETPTKYKTKMYKDYAYCKLNKLPQ
ncbi:flavonol synthase 1-like [Zingiber officinale]|uniref:Fe2OG dioxygenase domain-containing protein n=1 Tax=Zingiber officinale TaxID=94328 RepID=A0A8J5LEQ7_ZINOF|nr:flavonol synthase 1-like [Zingiber officinale]KAG6511797.1 hypothetical protein ZIOFF_029874 [Zingiber officinale]